ncbi:hypothetical protein [Methylobacterium sp. WL7]|uniref:hypothetical protein n=1 Tax=Methylobacterium sp. WL7 TaxID=2603900 RepID=UPI0011C9192C|nr:hypothetical protein [Methylobacterium sp. WL7]TXN47414.1 hypothetical protein FV233_05145 [Methylobacterium sp. WL7]
MSKDLAAIRGLDLRERLVASRLAVRDALAARPSVALRDAIAEADVTVSAAMRVAIATYEALAAAPSPAPEPARQGYDVVRTEPRVGLPPPRRLPSAVPVTPT